MAFDMGGKDFQKIRIFNERTVPIRAAVVAYATPNETGTPAGSHTISVPPMGMKVWSTDATTQSFWQDVKSVAVTMCAENGTPLPGDSTVKVGSQRLATTAWACLSAFGNATIYGGLLNGIRKEIAYSQAHPNVQSAPPQGGSNTTLACFNAFNIQSKWLVVGIVTHDKDGKEQNTQYLWFGPEDAGAVAGSELNPGVTFDQIRSVTLSMWMSTVAGEQGEYPSGEPDVSFNWPAPGGTNLDNICRIAVTAFPAGECVLTLMNNDGDQFGSAATPRST